MTLTSISSGGMDIRYCLIGITSFESGVHITSISWSYRPRINTSMILNLMLQIIKMKKLKYIVIKFRNLIIGQLLYYKKHWWRKDCLYGVTGKKSAINITGDTFVAIISIV